MNHKGWSTFFQVEKLPLFSLTICFNLERYYISLFYCTQKLQFESSNENYTHKHFAVAVLVDAPNPSQYFSLEILHSILKGGSPE